MPVGAFRVLTYLSFFIYFFTVECFSNSAVTFNLTLGQQELVYLEAVSGCNVRTDECLAKCGNIHEDCLASCSSYPNLAPAQCQDACLAARRECKSICRDAQDQCNALAQDTYDAACLSGCSSDQGIFRDACETQFDSCRRAVLTGDLLGAQKCQAQRRACLGDVSSQRELCTEVE